MHAAHRGVLVVGAAADVLQFFPEVAAGGIGVFHHHGVRQPPIAFVPFAGDQLGGLDGRDDGHQRHFRPFGGQFREVEGESGAADDELRSGPTGGLHHLFVVGDRYHAVGADHPGRSDGIGLADLVGQGQGIGGKEVTAIVMRAVETDAGGGNQADAAAAGHVPGQTPAGNAHAHPSLNQGIRYRITADGEGGEHGIPRSG